MGEGVWQQGGCRGARVRVCQYRALRPMRGEGGIVYNAHTFEVRVNRTTINQQNIKFNQQSDFRHMTRMHATHDGAILIKDPYGPIRPVFCRIWHVGYGFGPYNLRPFKWPVLGLTVRCRHPYKPGRTPVKYGTTRSPRSPCETVT